MTLSVVIPTHNRHEPLKRLLQSLHRQSLPKSQWEVIVVSNLPDAQLASQIRSVYHGDFQFHEVGQLGVNLARNLGAKKAQAPWVLFLDDDCLADDPYLLEKILLKIKEFPQMDGLGGLYKLPKKYSPIENLYQKMGEHWLRQSAEEDKSTFALLGGLAAYKTSCFEQFAFDENIVFGGAETSFNLNLFHGNKTLLLFDDLVVTHCCQIHLLNWLEKAFKQGFAEEQRQKLRCLPPKVFPSLLDHWKKAKWSDRLLLTVFDQFFIMGRLWAQKGHDQPNPTFAAGLGLFKKSLSAEWSGSRFKKLLSF